ncbi:MAG: hypothetical protein ACJAR2_001523 [Ilumatobacter sp.]|jgi:hypothetical protein
MVSHEKSGCDSAEPWRDLLKSWQTPASVLFGVHLHGFLQPDLRGLVRADDVGDPDATRIVYITVVVLAIIGVALVALVVWIISRTRPESQLFAPLETMATRGWRRQDPAAQRRSLDESRPGEARPLRREAAEPSVMSDFGDLRPVRSFDDLADGRPVSSGGPDGDLAEASRADPDVDSEAESDLAGLMSGATSSGQSNIGDEAGDPDSDDESDVNDDGTGPIAQTVSVEIDVTVEQMRPPQGPMVSGDGLLQGPNSTG